MKKTILSIVILLNFTANIYATDVTIPTVYTTNGSVTAPNLNGNFTALAQKVNGGLDNDNADTTNGYRFFEVKSTLPTVGTQGRTIFLTTDNTLNLDTGSTFVKSIVATGTPTANQVPVYSGSAWVPTATANLGFTSGMIMLWSGSAASIPSGWVICDGTNSTPNLRDRFVVGAGSTYAVAATGGAATVTIAQGNLPSYNLSATVYNSNGSGSTGIQGTTNGASTSSANIPSGGSGTALNVLNPYYALAYIMKT